MIKDPQVPAYQDCTFDLRKGASYPGLRRARIWMAVERENDLWCFKCSPGDILSPLRLGYRDLHREW